MNERILNSSTPEGLQKSCDVFAKLSLKNLKSAFLIDSEPE